MIKIGKQKYSLSLSMIVKDETATLETSLKSAAPLVDEIVVNWNGSNPETKKILDSYKCKIVSKPWCDDFADARNFSLDNCTGDFMIWLDADDEIIHPERVHEAIKEAFLNERCGALWTNWLYSFDDKGVCTSELWRERIVVRRYFRWQDRLHETLKQYVDCEHTFCDYFWIKHNATEKQIEESGKRNLAIILDEYEKQHASGDIDAKTTLDAARACKAMGHVNEALKLYNEYVETSGWDNERAHAFFQMAGIYRQYKKWEHALIHDAMGIKLKPSWPDGYLGLATTFFCQEKWEDCITQLTIAKMLKPPYGIMPVDKTSYDLKPYIMMSQALINMGKTEDALQAAKKALEMYPNNKVAMGLKGVAIEMLKNEDIIGATLHLKSAIEAEKRCTKSRLRHLLKAMPYHGVEHPAIRRLQAVLNGKPKDNRIVIFCGTQIEPWDPTYTEKGIGGSEEAVICIGKELVKLGWNVDVYNECATEGIYDGVNYENYDIYLKKNTCAAFISWRMASYMDFAPMKGEKRILWCHDVQKPEYYSEAHLKQIDKILMLSKYHRSNIPEVPEDKFMYTSNGILPEHFGDPEVMPEKNQNQFIYASSPDRGLDIVLETWPDILKIDPKATLHVYYGFTKNYDEQHKNDAGRRLFKENILNNMKQQGIFYHGMVGHKELANAYLRSQWWIYPTYFTEISCISAMKAQAAGCIPLTTNLAALAETVKYGYRMEEHIGKEENRKKWQKEMLAYVEGGWSAITATEMRKWALKTYSWEAVAKQWDAYLRAK